MLKWHNIEVKLNKDTALLQVREYKDHAELYNIKDKKGLINATWTIPTCPYQALMRCFGHKRRTKYTIII